MLDYKLVPSRDLLKIPGGSVYITKESLLYLLEVADEYERLIYSVRAETINSRNHLTESYERRASLL